MLKCFYESCWELRASVTVVGWKMHILKKHLSFDCIISLFTAMFTVAKKMNAEIPHNMNELHVEWCVKCDGVACYLFLDQDGDDYDSNHIVLVIMIMMIASSQNKMHRHIPFSIWHLSLLPPFYMKIFVFVISSSLLWACQFFLLESHRDTFFLMTWYFMTIVMMMIIHDIIIVIFMQSLRNDTTRQRIKLKQNAEE